MENTLTVDKQIFASSKYMAVKEHIHCCSTCSLIDKKYLRVAYELVLADKIGMGNILSVSYKYYSY